MSYRPAVAAIPPPDRVPHYSEITTWGRFTHPPAQLDVLAASWPPAHPLPRAMRKLALKQWQHIAILHESHYIGLVLFDAGYLGVSFVTAMRWDDGSRREVEHTLPPGLVKVADSIWHGESSLRIPNYALRIKNRLSDGHHHITGRIRGRLHIDIDVQLQQSLDTTEPLVVMHPIKPNRPFYTHKSPLRPSGFVRIGETELTLQPDRDFALLDEQKTFYPFHWFWHWATFAGRDTRGRPVAFNGCFNVLDNPEHKNENGFWLDGNLTPLGAIDFDFDADHPDMPWTISSRDGSTQLRFLPIGARDGHTRVGPLKSSFWQAAGTFEGTLPGGIRVEGIRGVCEDHHVTG